MSKHSKAHVPVKVTAHLASPLAGDSALRLDGLLEYALSLYHPKGVPGYKITRDGPPPAPGEIPIPLRREWLGGHLVGCCSDAILEAPAAEGVEHVNKRIGVEHAGLLAPSSRLVVSTTNSWTKSYRLPLRVRVVPRVCWFAVGDRREIQRALARHVHALGKKISIGYGRVKAWEVERTDADWSWFAPSPAGPVLMATLPRGDWLPGGLVGWREDYGAASPPYWCVSHYAEIVAPC